MYSWKCRFLDVRLSLEFVRWYGCGYPPDWCEPARREWNTCSAVAARVSPICGCRAGIDAGCQTYQVPGELGPYSLGRNLKSKLMNYFIKNDDSCIENDEFFVKNDEFCGGTLDSVEYRETIVITRLANSCWYYIQVVRYIAFLYRYI